MAGERSLDSTTSTYYKYRFEATTSIIRKKEFQSCRYSTSFMFHSMITQTSFVDCDRKYFSQESIPVITFLPGQLRATDLTRQD